MKPLAPDICVIGAGPGGLAVAVAAASLGKSVVLVENGRMGGNLFGGSVGKHALIAAAGRVEAVRRATEFGMAAVEPEVDFKAVNRHIRNVVEAVTPNGSVERLKALGVAVIQAEARFRDRRRLIAGDIEIRARRFVIATGSSPLLPEIEGLDSVEYLTPETIFGLTRKPDHLIVIGGDAVGLELAQAYRRLGSKVTMIVTGTALSQEDPEMAAIVLRRLRADGVQIIEEARVNRVERRNKAGIRADLWSQDRASTIEGSHLLIAAGRVANVTGLDLEKARVAYSPGGIQVSPRLATTNSRIHAIGGVTGTAPSVHASEYQAERLIRSLLLGQRDGGAQAVVPRVTFTDPELAHIGSTEAEAMKNHRGARVLRWPYSENHRAQAERKTEGHIKVIAGAKGEILGVTIVGTCAGEMIWLWALAMSMGMSLADIAGMVPAYPTMGEIGKRAAISYFASDVRKPIIRKLAQMLGVFR